MAFIALKVDVDTLRGTREGVPRLLALLERHGIRATFLFSLGPDHTGWALRRAFRPGFLGKVKRTSVLAHYGLRTLLYGVLLPGPDIGRVAAQEMRSARRAGHPCGIHCWDHVVWHDHVRRRDAAWTTRQMQLAHDRFVDIFAEAPATFGAAGWQMNAAALKQVDAWGLAYASDGRGDAPYLPIVDGRPLRHVELPTTLPTFDEVIGVDGVTESNVAGHLLRLTAASEQNQVFTLHAELEGGLLLPAFDTLLAGWKAQGHQLGDLAQAFALIGGKVPSRAPAWGRVTGRSGELMVAAGSIGPTSPLG